MNASAQPRLTPELIDELACTALRREFELAGKPGLVSPHSNGSHCDMHGGHFRASIAALTGYFGECARLGAADMPFAALQSAGRDAERTMLAATGGINTHKGAIFTLGLLSAALGAHGDQPSDAEPIGDCVARRWGSAIRAAATEAPPSHGRSVGARFGLPGAREQAAAGFPLLFALVLPTLQRARLRGLGKDEAALEALIACIAVLPDTNLAHRGGLAGLNWAQAEGAAFMRAGGMEAADARGRLAQLNRDFIARRLSPGGSADLLAAALLLETVTTRASRTRRRSRTRSHAEVSHT